MPLIQIRISHAAPVLSEMRKLLDVRRTRRIKRAVFLHAWGRLRHELAETVEYQEFVTAVRTRDGYKCRVCSRPARTVHHRKRVALAPEQALLVSNGEVRCEACHAAAPGHKHMRKSA